MDNSKSNIDFNQILATLKHLQQENATLRNSVNYLQDQPQPLAPVPAAPAMVALEPKISLLEKFDGTHPKFRGFVSQVRLIIQLQPHRYPNDTTRIGFVGTLLARIVVTWFAPILETSSPLLQNFNAFMVEFETMFGDSDKARTSANKLCQFQQGTRSATVYASEFKQLAPTSTGEKMPWLISFDVGFMTMFKIFCWHSQTFFPSVKPSPRQFGATIICSNVAKKRKSPPMPRFGSVALLRYP